MSERGWKQYERRVAALLGTRRIPVTGERQGADIETPLFVFQVKKRKSIPTYLEKWLDGIRGAGLRRRPAKVGVIVMQNPRRPDMGSFVVLSLRDWLDLHGPTTPTERVFGDYRLEMP